MNIEALNQILQNNLGNKVTPELLVGILTAVQSADYAPINIEDIPSEVYGEFTIHCARLRTILDEIVPLHQRHWEETEKYRHGIPLNPNYEYMMQCEDQGRFLVFTVRHGDLLVGNCMMYMTKSTHTQEWIAEEDTIFILSEYRKGRLGLRFIKYVEDVLRNMGITEIRVTVKTVNRVGDLLQAVGYQHTANQLTKIL